MEVPMIISPSLLFSLTLSAFTFMFLDKSLPGHTVLILQRNETDKLALLSFNSLITEDPLGVLNSWNESSHFCYWAGVQCNSKSLRVTVLDLNRQELVGTISPHVGNLSFLKILDLSENSIMGEIPHELGNLRRLRTLNVSFNSLGGKIPNNLSSCSRLKNLALNHNYLIGNIPYELGSLSDLRTFFLGTNNISSAVPSSLGNLTTMIELDMAYNLLHGEVPKTISQLKNLKILRLSVNNLSGEFPVSFYNLSSLEFIAISYNNLSGTVRKNIGAYLPNLRILWLGYNFFVGNIPESFPNASKLERIDVTGNNFTGKVLLNLGNLRRLVYLGLGFNHLGSDRPDDLDFITSLTNCSNLDNLQLQTNRFGGELPASIANLSTKLTVLKLHTNSIFGNIPREISKLRGLTVLHMQLNNLSGAIPDSLGILSSLTQLVLGLNRLTGKIPDSIGNITRLMWLLLPDNELEGEIPSSLGNCEKLVFFYLARNNLTGTIPRELTRLSSILAVNISYNSLIGPVPEHIGNWSRLVEIDLSYNRLYGNIPNAIRTCLALDTVFLQGNRIDGEIPDLKLLRDLNYLDLSNNNLSGKIPDFLSSLSSLVYLNLSLNNLEGEVPSTGIFSNIIAMDIRGNPNLCGGIPDFHLLECYKEQGEKSDARKRLKSLHLILFIVLPTLFAAVSSLLFSIYLIRKKLKEPLSSSSSRYLNFFPMISYQDLVNATGGFSSENLIGSGSFGNVYKGSLTPDSKKVAVKVLKLERKGASKSFMAECEALKNIRHHNLVKVITACSSIDFQGNEFKAMVYEFMSNGNLNDSLHPEEGKNESKILNVLQRIEISLGVASALEYLHHQCETQVIHCDLKPQNILLDDDMRAHVGDFGLARIIPELKMTEKGNQFSSLGIKGTMRYTAPEYGMGAPVSTLGDVTVTGLFC